MMNSLLNTWQIFWWFSQVKYNCSESKEIVTSLLERWQVTKITFKRPITLDMSHTVSCSVWRCCLRVLLPDLIVILWEVWADMHASNTGVVLVKEQTVLTYDLRAARGEGALSSLIIQSDSACMTYFIWLRVSTAVVKRVLMRDKAASLMWRAWIRCQAAQVSGVSVSRLHIKIWRV